MNWILAFGASTLLSCGPWLKSWVSVRNQQIYLNTTNSAKKSKLIADQTLANNLLMADMVKLDKEKKKT